MYSNSTAWFSGSQLRVHLDIQVGEHAIDYANVAQKEKMSELQVRIRQLLDQVEQITKEQNYQRVRIHFGLISRKRISLILMMSNLFTFSTARSVSGRPARAPTVECFGGLWPRRLFWSEWDSGRCAIWSASLKPKNWCNISAFFGRLRIVGDCVQFWRKTKFQDCLGSCVI